MTSLLAGLCGVLVAAGVVALVAASRTPAPAAIRPRLRRSRSGELAAGLRHRWWQAAVALLGGAVAAMITGWPLLLVLVPVIGFGLPVVLSAPPNRDLMLLEALDRWVRSLASLLPTGRSISDAIRASTRLAPPLLAARLRILSGRLDDRWTIEQALRALADELDSPDADGVLAALALAAQRGGTGAVATLTALGDSIQDRLRALREIETERAKPRIVVRQVTIITVAVLGLALVFGGDFFAPYGSGLGQLLLAGLVLVYLGSLVFLRRLTLPRPRQRILGRAG